MGLEQLSHRGQGVLVRLESTSAELAEEIAARLKGQSQDLRDAVRVARLAPSLGVERDAPLLPVGGRGGVPLEVNLRVNNSPVIANSLKVSHS